MNRKIVVVGGGAGGLELVVKLAKKFKRNQDVEVTLIDCNPTHIWKPLLHEVATGTLNSNHDETSYRLLAKKYQFSFVLGRVGGINTDGKHLNIDPILDENHQEIVATRQIDYTHLVLSVGSLCNDFGTPGVTDHCLLLDSRQQAEKFHSLFINHLHRLSDTQNPPKLLSVIIVGGGATGVELAADLHKVAKQLPDYGFADFSSDNLSVTVVEAAPRILGQLPERISVSVTKELNNIGVHVRTQTKVQRVHADSVVTHIDESIPANLVVWAAGIKAPSFISESGLPTDSIGRVQVDKTLCVVGHENTFAIGDCCACPMDDGQFVPPRAQSAHQMASTAYKNIVANIQGQPLKEFKYKDFGSLISLSEFSTIGNLMGNLMRGTVFIEGWIARLFYLSLYRMHQSAIHGWGATLLIMLGDRIYKATRADIKLH